MRVLFTTTGGAGHVGPLVPFARALLGEGHEVLVAVRRSNTGAVLAAGLPVREVGDAPEAAVAAVFASVQGLGFDEANERVGAELFAGLHGVAALPGVQAAIEEWRPDVLVHESAELAGPLAAERAGLPRARVSLTLAWSEERFLPAAGHAMAPTRAALGLPADPELAWMRDGPVLSLTPLAFEDPAAPGPAHTQRFREDEEPAGALPAHWWPGQDGPLVYVTFGSVAPTMPYFPGVYLDAIAALAALPVRVLLTVGRAADPAALGPLPPNVHVERWVPQSDVVPHAAAMVCHGGFGTVRGALAAGLPLVVVPLFADQPYNARRVASLGAGIELEGGPAAVAGVGDAVRRVLADPSYAAAAADIAADVRALPPVDAAVGLLTDLAAAGARM